MTSSNTYTDSRGFFAELTGEHSTLAIHLLNELDSKEPTRAEAEDLKRALTIVKDPVLNFQIKKSLRLAAFKLKKTTFKVSLSGLEKLLKETSRLEDLALGIATVATAEAFLAADYFRDANWHSYPAPILPSFCFFFSKNGSIKDSDSLQELTRHPDPTVLTSALAALEKLDPHNLQSIILPLLNSTQSIVKAQAIQAFYHWNKSEALKHLQSMLFSCIQADVSLALHHASFFPYPEIEPYLIRVMMQNSSPAVLMRISQIFKSNANQDLPFRLLWVSRSLEGQHKSLVKGLVLGVIKSLIESGKIGVSAQEFLNDLQTKVRAEELRLIRASCKITAEEENEEDEEDVSAHIIPDKPIEEKTISTEIKSLPIVEKVEKIEQKPVKTADFSNYESLNINERAQMLARSGEDFFNANSEKLKALFTSAAGKELVALINLFGKFGQVEDAETIKKLCKSDNPDIICACIRALAKLDTDFLCLYLPQFMQEKNGKIRMTATRTFVSIDRDSIKSLMRGLLGSSQAKQRMLAVSTCMLVDFNTIREPLLEAMAKETSPEISEKLGIVLSSNPDRELLNQAYRIFRKSRSSTRTENQQIVKMLAENLASALGQISSADELLKEAEKIYEEEEKAAKAAREKSGEDGNVGAEAEAIARENLLKGDEISIQDILTSESKDPKTKRAKATIIIWVLAAIVWGGSIAMLIARVLFGE